MDCRVSRRGCCGQRTGTHLANDGYTQILDKPGQIASDSGHGARDGEEERKSGGGEHCKGAGDVSRPWVAAARLCHVHSRPAQSGNQNFELFIARDVLKSLPPSTRIAPLCVSTKMAEYDLTKTIIPYCDRHLVFPLLAHLVENELFAAEEVQKAQYELAKETNMVDYAVSLFEQLHSDEAVPEGQSDHAHLDCI